MMRLFGKMNTEKETSKKGRDQKTKQGTKQRHVEMMKMRLRRRNGTEKNKRGRIEMETKEEYEEQCTVGSEVFGPVLGLAALKRRFLQILGTF